MHLSHGIVEQAGGHLAVQVEFVAQHLVWHDEHGGVAQGARMVRMGPSANGVGAGQGAATAHHVDDLFVAIAGAGIDLDTAVQHGVQPIASLACIEHRVAALKCVELAVLKEVKQVRFGEGGEDRVLCQPGQCTSGLHEHVRVPLFIRSRHCWGQTWTWF
ncbi:MAG: hypothetical protein WAP57_12135 [Aquabacterium commune]